MDTSKQYTDMCSKASEIQAIKGDIQDGFFMINGHELITSVGDNALQCISQESMTYSWGCVDNYYEETTDDFIWLPRQDQLQDMVKEIKEKNHFVFRFYTFLKSRYIKATYQNAYVVLSNMYDGVSMEQLWLAFVMNEKFGKVWNNDKWETIK